jgi:hypothetical protein
MRSVWAVSFAVMFAACGPGLAPEDAPPQTPERTRQTLWARPLCVPLAVSSAFDAQARRSGWRDEEVQRFQAPAASAGAQITRELDWDGNTTVYAYDAPGDAEDFTATMQWAWFGGLQKTVPTSIQRSYTFDPVRNTTDQYSYDENGRLYAFRHDYTYADVDDRVEKFIYDWDGNLTQIRIERSDPLLTHVYDVEYDTHGRITRWGEDYKGIDDYMREEFAYDGQGLLKEWTKRTPEGVQERVRVAWTVDLNPIVYEVTGVWGIPYVKACQ